MLIDMRKLPFASIIFIVILISFFYLKSDRISQAQTSSQEELCKVDPLGSWREFPNGCADSCEYARNPESTLCTQVITSGCNCDPNSCWNGQSCEPINNSLSVADLNKDGKVDILDYEYMKARFFKNEGDYLSADINGDKKVDIQDYAILVIEWNK